MADSKNKLWHSGIKDIQEMIHPDLNIAHDAEEFLTNKLVNFIKKLATFSAQRTVNKSELLPTDLFDCFSRFFDPEVIKNASAEGSKALLLCRMEDFNIIARKTPSEEFSERMEVEFRTDIQYLIKEIFHGAQIDGKTSTKLEGLLVTMSVFVVNKAITKCQQTGALVLTDEHIAYTVEQFLPIELKYLALAQASTLVERYKTETWKDDNDFKALPPPSAQTQEAVNNQERLMGPEDETVKTKISVPYSKTSLKPYKASKRAIVSKTPMSTKQNKMLHKRAEKPKPYKSRGITATKVTEPKIAPVTPGISPEEIEPTITGSSNVTDTKITSKTPHSPKRIEHPKVQTEPPITDSSNVTDPTIADSSNVTDRTITSKTPHSSGKTHEETDRLKVPSPKKYYKRSLQPKPFKSRRRTASPKTADSKKTSKTTFLLGSKETKRPKVSTPKKDTESPRITESKKTSKTPFSLGSEETKRPKVTTPRKDAERSQKSEAVRSPQRTTSPQITEPETTPKTPALSGPKDSEESSKVSSPKKGAVSPQKPKELISPLSTASPQITKLETTSQTTLSSSPKDTEQRPKSPSPRKNAKGALKPKPFKSSRSPKTTKPKITSKTTHSSHKSPKRTVHPENAAPRKSEPRAFTSKKQSAKTKTPTPKVKEKSKSHKSTKLKTKKPQSSSTQKEAVPKMVHKTPDSPKPTEKHKTLPPDTVTEGPPTVEFTDKTVHKPPDSPKTKKKHKTLPKETVTEGAPTAELTEETSAGVSTPRKIDMSSILKKFLQTKSPGKNTFIFQPGSAEAMGDILAQSIEQLIQRTLQKVGGQDTMSLEEIIDAAKEMFPKQLYRHVVSYGTSKLFTEFDS